MTSLDRILRRGARRLALARCVTTLTCTLTFAALALLAIRIAEKGFATPAPDWAWAWGIAGGVALLGTIAWVWMTRPDASGIARLLDERGGLKATLATAIWARTDTAAHDDAWHAATIDEGDRAAGRIDPRSAIPIVVPRYWIAPVLMAVVTLGGHWIPQQDVMALFTPDNEQEQVADAEEERQLIEVRDAVEEARKDIDAQLTDLNDDALNELLKASEEELDKPTTVEELRRNEMRRLTGIKDRLDEMERKGEAAEAKALKELTAQLKTPEGETSPITKMAEAMKNGNISGAIKQLEALKKQLESAEGLTEQQKQALAEQLQQLADQLNQAAQSQQQAMQNIAQQAGLPQNLANNPQALQQAIQNAQNLTPQQKQQLQQQLQNMQKAAGQCKQCAGSMSQLAQAMGQQGMQGQMGQAMQGLQGQLSQMEMLQQQLAQLQSAQASTAQQLMSLSQGQGAQSMLPPWAQKQKKGGKGGTNAGNSGRGGDEDPESHADGTDLAQQKANTAVDPTGPLIGSMVAEGGQQVRGESVAEFREAAQAAGEAASDAIDERLVPKEYEDVVKKYFGGLEKAAEETPAPKEDEPESP